MLQRLRQCQREGGIRAVPVIGDIAGRRGIGDQQAAGGLHFRQTAASAARGAGQRIVPAGIEDHEIDRVARILDIAQRVAEARRLTPDVLFGPGIGIHRHQIVQPLGLHAVPGIIDHAHRLRAASLKTGAMGGERLLHPVFPGIEDEIDLKADLRQRLGHQLGVICGIGELPSALLIVRISDDQRIARRLNRLSLSGQHGKKTCNSKQE